MRGYPIPDEMPPTAVVVTALSFIISEALLTMESQRHYPVADPDKMDAMIDFEGTRVKVLRDIRERFENEMARPMERE